MINYPLLPVYPGVPICQRRSSKRTTTMASPAKKLSALVVEKFRMFSSRVVCYEQTFSEQLLMKAKSATYQKTATTEHQVKLSPMLLGGRIRVPC